MLSSLKTDNDMAYYLISFIKNVKKKAIISGKVPLGLTMGWPIVIRKDERLCIKFLFYLREPKGTYSQMPQLLYPVTHVLTAVWSSGEIIESRKLLSEDKNYSIEFRKHVGEFPHDSIKRMKTITYNKMWWSLLDYYSKYINFETEGTKFSEEDAQQMGILLEQLMEPGLKQFYCEYGRTFFEKFSHNIFEALP